MSLVCIVEWLKQLGGCLSACLTGCSGLGWTGYSKETPASLSPLQPDVMQSFVPGQTWGLLVRCPVPKFSGFLSDSLPPGLLLLLFLFKFWDRVSLSIPGWPQTHRDWPVLRIKGCATMPGSFLYHCLSVPELSCSLDKLTFWSFSCVSAKLFGDSFLLSPEWLIAEYIYLV